MVEQPLSGIYEYGERTDFFLYRLREIWTGSGYRRLSASDAYLRLFRHAEPRHRACGEGSVMYMPSRVAIKNIHEFNSKARLIAMIRNPVDVVHAYHSQIIRSPLEDQTDFEVAWSLQEKRRRGERIPKSCVEPLLVDYHEVGRLGSQLARVVSIFPREQVKILVFEDVASDPRRVYAEVLQFLDVDPDERQHFPKVNENVQFEWDWARRIVASSFARRLQIMGLQNTGLLKPLYWLSASKKPRKPLRPYFRAHLTEVFEPEVRLIEQHIGRDLPHWRERDASLRTAMRHDRLQH
jgi:Sulfotransferase domain